jgi:hypothetical protein
MYLGRSPTASIAELFGYADGETKACDGRAFIGMDGVERTKSAVRMLRYGLSFIALIT